MPDIPHSLVVKNRNPRAAACDEATDAIEDLLRRLHADQARRIAESCDPEVIRIARAKAALGDER